MRTAGARFGALVLFLAACRSVFGLEELTAGDIPGADADAGTDAAKDDGVLGADASRGCPSCRVIVEGERAPTEIAALAGRLAWIRSGSGGNVVASGFDGGAIEIGSVTPIDDAHDLTIAEGSAHAVGADGVFRRFLDQSSCADASGVLRLSAFGGDAMLVLKAGELSLGGCGARTAILADNLVAIAGEPPYAWLARSNGSIARCDAANGNCAGTATALVGGQGDVKAIAVGSSRVAWTTLTTTGAEIRSASKAALGSSAPPTTVAVLAELPATLVASGEDVHWTETTSGRVRSAPIAGGDASTIADGLTRPWGLLVTPGDVYVTESGAGRIVAIPR